MKYLLILALILSGCQSIAAQDDSDKTPTGKELYTLLFDNLDRSLAGETQCPIGFTEKDRKSSTLKDVLIQNLSISSDSNFKTTLSSSCNKSKYELKNTKVIESWRCSIYVVSDYIEQINSSITFHVSLNKNKIIESSLICL